MRWRRRRFARIRRRERERRLLPNSIVVKEHGPGGTSSREWRLPRAPLPEGVPFWNGRGKPPELGPGQAMVMEISIDATFHRCDVCGSVWQRPHQHTRRECRGSVVAQVMDS